MKFELSQKSVNRALKYTIKPAFAITPPFHTTFQILPTVVSFFEFCAEWFYDCTIERIKIGDINAEWVSHDGATDDKVILYAHGGGFVSCSPATHRGITSYLSRCTGKKVLCVDYRKAPKYKYPTQLHDIYHAYEWLINQGWKGSEIAIVGDSAGGNLALSTTFHILEKRWNDRPACVAVMSPWADLTMKGPSIQYNYYHDCMLPAWRMDQCRRLYAGRRKDYSHYLLSPCFGKFDKFPPLMIHAGSTEVLLSDAKFLHRQAKSQGCDSTLKVWQDGSHVFQAWTKILPDARQSLREISQWVMEQWTHNHYSTT